MILMHSSFSISWFSKGGELKGRHGEGSLSLPAATATIPVAAHTLSSLVLFCLRLRAYFLHLSAPCLPDFVFTEIICSRYSVERQEAYIYDYGGVRRDDLRH